MKDVLDPLLFCRGVVSTYRSVGLIDCHRKLGRTHLRALGISLRAVNNLATRHKRGPNSEQNVFGSCVREVLWTLGQWGDVSGDENCSAVVYSRTSIHLPLQLDICRDCSYS